MLLTRPPLYSVAEATFLARLACVKPAANVRSEPGSNSPLDPYHFPSQSPPRGGLHDGVLFSCVRLDFSAIQFSETELIILPTLLTYSPAAATRKTVPGEGMALIPFASEAVNVFVVFFPAHPSPPPGPFESQAKMGHLLMHGKGSVR